MLLSDISVKRPVFAAVMSLILVAFGLVSFMKLPLQEYPNIDPPVVSIDTRYPGAAAEVVETRITEIIEDRIAGLEGIKFIESTTSDGRSQINVEFDINRDIDAAANDIRDRVSGVLDDLPLEAEPPDIQKVDSSDDVIMWLNLTSEDLSVPELTDYAERYLVDRFSVIDGVARVRVGGAQSLAMRVWIDRDALAARQLTAEDIETALRRDNIELPAGSIESDEIQFSIRINPTFRSVQDFRNLVIKSHANDGIVRLGDVAKVEFTAEDDRSWFRGNTVPMVGLGIIKQSNANTVAVARSVNIVADVVNPNLPAGMKIHRSFDSSVFIERSIQEVYQTLAIAVFLVILVIYSFIGSGRATLIPAITVPVSVIATFMVLYFFEFSVNLLTLLALVLAIGLVVDDTIVVLENIARRMDVYGESPLVAAYRGGREIGFAVIATTLVLVAVFVPIIFLGGDLGRLFSEFAITMAVAVGFSSFVALTLSPMLASKILKSKQEGNRLTESIDVFFKNLSFRYIQWLKLLMAKKALVIGFTVAMILGCVALFKLLPSEYAPREDRGAFFVIVNGPEGATHNYMSQYMDEIEKRLMPYVEDESVTRLLVRTPRAFGGTEVFNTGIVIIVLNDWAKRKPGFALIGEVRGKLSDLPGVRAFPVMRQALGGGLRKSVQFVLGGGSYEQLVKWRDILNLKLREGNYGVVDPDWDFKETQPQLKIEINYDQAAAAGVNVREISRTLETMLGSRRATTFSKDGREYNVRLESFRSENRSPTDIQNIFIRSATSGELMPLANFINIKEIATSANLSRYNRIRSITLEANVAEGFTLSEVLTNLENLVKANLPETAIIDYKGASKDLKSSSDSILFVFLLGLIVVYLVLAAQFESFVHPFIIMFTVPLAIFGALLGILATGGSLNIYSQIGLIMLVGLAAKNGILIVEFINQLRDQGEDFEKAIYKAAQSRLRPILMTSITTAIGSLPLIFSSGAGSETRLAIGVVIFFGVVYTTIFTLFVVPVAYNFGAAHTESPLTTTKNLEKQLSH